MHTEKSAKKPISDKRRMQNKEAQKKYRERQKRSIQVLRDLATSTRRFSYEVPANIGQDVDWSGEDCRGSSAKLGERSQDSSTPFHVSALSQTSDSTDEPNVLERPPYPDASIACRNHNEYPSNSTPTAVLALKTPNDNHIISQLLNQETVQLDETVRSQLLQKALPLQSIIEAGLRALAHEPTPPPDSSPAATGDPKLRTDKIILLQNASKNYTPPLPDIHRNHIRMHQIMWVAACVANATSLGLILGPTSCENIESPFYTPSISPSSAATSSLHDFQSLNPSLRPTPTQITHSHHPYIDVLPFPSFRDTIIKLAYADEPMIDEDDLCADLQNDGLVCWGSSLGGGSVGRGSGAPWDARSWEAKPWFLRKWWVLIGGREGEIWRQTEWWCEMRGERVMCPW